MMHQELKTDFSHNSLAYHRIRQYWCAVCLWLHG